MMSLIEDCVSRMTKYSAFMNPCFVFSTCVCRVPSCLFQLHECLAQLITENLEVTRWLLKLDDEFDGRGIAYLDVAEHLPCYQWALKVQ